MLSTGLTAQNETKIWYFGANAGLDFSTSPPTVLTNGVNNTLEGCSSIADASGNLLFYTDGVTIWNKLHQVMANGAGLLGHQSTTQAALIVKQPASNIKYYVFTLDYEGNPNGLQYSIVDMSLASGDGSVTVKNQFLFAPSEEKLAATKHANGTDVWIMTHDYNSNKFRAYLLTGSGVNLSPVISAIGSTHAPVPMATLGQLKFSPDSKKIGLSFPDMNASELYDFNNNTGVLTNSVVLTNSLYGTYGCEFSNNSSKFYAASASDGTIYQWNLCAGSNSAIVQSLAIINPTNTGKGSMQLAPDGKIYVMRPSNQVLGVINNPNEAGNACNYAELGQSIAPKTCSMGLPGFVSSYFMSGPSLQVNTSPVSASICAGETLTMTASGIGNYTWSSGQSGPNATVNPGTTSNYTVTATYTNGCIYTKSITALVSPCTGLENSSNAENPKIYPIPCKDFLHIEFLAGHSLKIIEQTGNTVLSIPVLTHNENIDLRYLGSGIYLLRLQTENGVLVTKRLIVSK